MLQRRHRDDGSLILDELALCQGETRVDIAVLNGELVGYEIKSHSDSLVRLKRQQDLYSRILDRAVLVTSEERINDAKAIVPKWWGLFAIRSGATDHILVIHRTPKRNPNPHALSIAQLLWRNEAIELIRAKEPALRVISKPRKHLWALLVELYSLRQLRKEVREALKRRAGWRQPELLRPTSSDDLSQLCATSLHSLGLPARPRSSQ